jgi:hypothetical protein
MLILVIFLSSFNDPAGIMLAFASKLVGWQF